MHFLPIQIVRKVSIPALSLGRLLPLLISILPPTINKEGVRNDFGRQFLFLNTTYLGHGIFSGAILV
jgi:hypothetical protein